jgi:hypothetical protein
MIYGWPSGPAGFIRDSNDLKSGLERLVAAPKVVYGTLNGTSLESKPIGVITATVPVVA